MFGGIFKTVFSKKSKKTENTGEKLAVELKNKSQDLLNLAGQKLEQAKDEIVTIKGKFNNLLDTNYKLGLKHLENGNLSEATFRFRFINKFWPNHLDSYYQLAYCLVLKNKFPEAKKVLESLVHKDSHYRDNIKELLDLVNASEAKKSQNNQQA